MEETDYPDLGKKVQRVVSAYLEAWKSPYSEIDDLDSLEREELLGVISDELGVGLERDVVEELLTKRDLTVDDIVESIEEGGVMLY